MEMMRLRWHYVKYAAVFFVSKIPVVLLLTYTGFLDVYLWERRFSDFRWGPYKDVLPQKLAAIRRGESVPMPGEFGAAYVTKHGPRGECVPSKASSKPPPLARLLVLSPPDATQERRRLRTLLAMKPLAKWKLRPTFLVGLSDAYQSLWVGAEAGREDDLLVSPAPSERPASAAAFLAGLHWALTQCEPGPPLVLAEERHVQEGLLVPLMEALAKRNGTSERLLLSQDLVEHRPARFRWRRDYVSLADYPFSRFPPYPSRRAPIALTHSAALDLFYATYFGPKYPEIGPYLGILAKLLNVPMMSVSPALPEEKRL